MSMSSLSSGIKASEELKELYEGANDVKTRWIKVVISEDGNEFEAVDSAKGTLKMSEDFEAIKEALDEDKPCFVLVRLEKRSAIKRNGVNFPLWLLVTYVPDTLKVKDRMIYASSVDPLKSDLGYRYFDDEFSIKTKEDCSWDEYNGFRSKDAPKPYSQREIVQMRASSMEEDARNERGIKQGKIGGYHSVSIPMSTGTREALTQIKSGKNNFTHLAIDSNGATLDHVESGFFTTDELPSKIHETEPGFYLFNWTHDGKEDLFFIYCCPDDSPIRLRMPYSTTKPSVVESTEKTGLTIAKKLEIREGTELSEKALKEGLSNKRNTWASSSSSSSSSSYGGGSSFNSSGGTFQGFQGLKSTGLNTWGGSSNTKVTVSTQWTARGSQQSKEIKAPSYTTWSQSLPGMTGNSNNTTTKKKIVRAPEGAYM